MENWLCKAYTVWQILWSATYLQQYLQRSNYLSTSALHAFRCRWQMFSCFFNFIVGGLRIKIRVATVSHKTNSPLCPPRPLWWKPKQELITFIFLSIPVILFWGLFYPFTLFVASCNACFGRFLSWNERKQSPVRQYQRRNKWIESSVSDSLSTFAYRKTNHLISWKKYYWFHS